MSASGPNPSRSAEDEKKIAEMLENAALVQQFERALIKDRTGGAGGHVQSNSDNTSSEKEWKDTLQTLGLEQKNDTTVVLSTRKPKQGDKQGVDAQEYVYWEEMVARVLAMLHEGEGEGDTMAPRYSVLFMQVCAALQRYLSSLALPHLTSSHLISPHLTLPHFTSPHPHLTSPHLTSPHLTSPHLTSPCLLHLTSPSSSHLSSPTKVEKILSWSYG